MTIAARSLVAALAVACSSPVLGQFSHPRPSQRAADEFMAMLQERKFEDLERIGVEARTKRTMLTDGQPVLAPFYTGVAGCSCPTPMVEEMWVMRRQRLEEWSRRMPASATAKLALAIYPVGHAWAARGSGYAHTVSKQAWAVFGERIEAGRKALEALGPEFRRDPGWYSAMLDVGLSQKWPRERFLALFEEAVKAHPGYMPLYFAGSNYLSPEWYGSTAELRGFIEQSAERTRATMGETLYARLNWAHWNQEMFTSGQTDWNRMRAGFERIVADYPDPWNINNFAKFACFAQDWRALGLLLPAIGTRPVMAAWHDSPGYFVRCRDKALLEAGANAPGGTRK